MNGLIRLFYNAMYPVVAFVMLPALIWKMIHRGKYRHKFGQRFAIYSQRVQKRLRAGEWTWVHAVSVGEVLIALKLIQRLREREPNRAFVLSTTTSTGFQLANEHRSDWLEPIYNPLDFILFTRRALALIRPRQLLLVEAEVWPNLVAGVKKRGATALLVNARLSPRSEARFRQARWITGPIFNQLDAICVPDPEDIARWRNLGVDESRIRVTGSIKFDEPPADAPTRDFTPLLRTLGVREGDPILLGASTHKGEEADLARALLELRKSNPRWFFLSVPRHAERAAEVRTDLEKLGLTVALRSELSDQSPPSNPPPAALLINTTGELRDWYASATIVFVGKSLRSKGGQNPAEAIRAGRPVIFGPHMRNFEVLTRDLLRHGGAQQIPSAEELAPALEKLLADPAARAALVENGRTVVARHLGATDRTCDIAEGFTARQT